MEARFSPCPSKSVEQFRQRHAAPRDGLFHQPRAGAVRLCAHEAIGDGGKEAYAFRSREENDGGVAVKTKRRERKVIRGIRPGGGMPPPREHPRVDMLQPVPQGMKACCLPAAKRVGGAGEFVQRQQRFTQLPVQGGMEGRGSLCPGKIQHTPGIASHAALLGVAVLMRSRCSIAIQSA